MRILLVQAYTAIDEELVYPLGLAWLAAHLDAHQVRIFDVNLVRDRPLEALEQELRGSSPEVVGVSLRNIKVALPGTHGDELAPQRELLRTIRRVAPQAVVIAGGAAFSLYPGALMERLPQLDLGLWGEGEHRFPLLLEQLDRPWAVPGVYYRQGGRVLFSGDAPRPDLATLRPPRRDLVPHGPYADSSFVGVGVQSKRGCALRCIHCSDTWLVGRSIRTRSPVRVVDEIEELVRVHGVQEFFFCDQIFNIPPGHAIDICKEIVARELDVRWAAWFNEHRNALPEELLVWLGRAGCGLLSFSPDHVTDRMLRGLDKNFRRADLLGTLGLAKRHGFDVEYSFFLNAPGEDLRSLAAIFRFLARARRELGAQLRTFTLLMMGPIRIYPHTRLARMAVEAGLIDQDDDLVEARFWNPGPLSAAVGGIQVGASVAYQARGALRRLRGASAPAVERR